MDKSIKSHYDYINKELDHSPTGSKLDELAHYHNTMTANFQHERAIHLAVTLFFAGLMILFFGIFIFLSFTLPMSGMAAVFIYGTTGFLSFALLVTEMMYIRHYYRLENGVAKLYAQTARMQELKDTK